jgi:hypothetical protein
LKDRGQRAVCAVTRVHAAFHELAAEDLETGVFKASYRPSGVIRTVAYFLRRLAGKREPNTAIGSFVVEKLMSEREYTGHRLGYLERSNGPVAIG